MSMNPVVHFEMPTEDHQRVKDFYSAVFGWELQQFGNEDYAVATTTATGEDGRPTTPGAINGGFFTKSDDKPDQVPSVVISVKDIKEHAAKVKAAGGEVLGEPMDIPGIGLYVSFRDTEGNRVTMLQPK